MAFSTQRAVSNGSLQLLALSINFFDKSEITVYLNSVPTTAYTWATANSIHMNSVVPNGVELLVRRTTDISEVRHVFSLGAQFKDSTLDDDFRQILHIAQEAVEGANVGDIYSTLNMHGNTISNVGPAVADGDAISLGQVRTESQGAFLANTQAQAAAAAAAASQGDAAASKVAAANSATASANSATLSQQQVALATTQAGNAATSAAAALASKNAAATSETNSATSATNSANSATASATAKTGAETARDAAINASAQVQYGTVPLFSVQWWGGKRSAIPAGYIPGDGQAISRSLYTDVTANVVAMMGTITDASWVATNTLRGNWATGDGSTTWRVPDLNGKSAGTVGAPFLRGDGTLSSAIQGTIQLGQIEAHTHAFSAMAARNVYPSAVGGGTTGVGYFDVSTPAVIAPTGGNETRPLNVTGCFIIKVFGAVNNTGSVDANQIVTTLGIQDSRIANLEAATIKAYANWELGDAHPNPVGPTTLAFGLNRGSKNIVYDPATRWFTVTYAGLYTARFTALSGSTAPTDIVINHARLSTVLNYRRGYASSPTTAIHAELNVRLQAGDRFGVSITGGTIYNPGPNDAGYFGTLSILRIDD